MGRNEFRGKFVKKKKRNPNQNKDVLRFNSLSDEFKKELEKTGLVEHVRVVCGSLRNRERNPCVEFRFTGNVIPEDFQRYESDGHELKDRFYNALRKNISEFQCFETVCIAEGVYKEMLRIYDSVHIDREMEMDIKRRSIEIMLREVKSYNLQR